MAPRSKNFTISVAGRSSRCKAFNLNILKLTSTCSWPSPIKITENFVLFLLKEVKVSIIYNGKRVRKAALIIGFAKYSISQIISLSFSFLFTCSVSFWMYRFAIPQIVSIFFFFSCLVLKSIQFLRSYMIWIMIWICKEFYSSDHISPFFFFSCLVSFDMYRGRQRLTVRDWAWREVGQKIGVKIRTHQKNRNTPRKKNRLNKGKIEDKWQ